MRLSSVRRARLTSGLMSGGPEGIWPDILEHPNPGRYAGRRIFVVRRDAYAYIVPFVEDARSVFLKTIIPSRKMTRKYLGEE